MQWPGCRAFLPAWRVFWALAPARLFAPGLLLSSVKLGPSHGCLEREDGTIPPRGLGSTSKFLSKGYLCKRCLVPSPPQPRRLEPSLLNGASAEPRSSNARRFGGELGSSLLPELVWRTPLCSDSSGSFLSTGAAGIGGMICCHCCTSGFSARLFFSGCACKRLPCDTPSASLRGFSLSGHPGASSTRLISLCYGNLRGKGIVFFHGKPLSHRDVLGNERPGSLPPPAVT